MKNIFDFIFVFSLIIFLFMVPPIGLILQNIFHVHENIVAFWTGVSLLGIIVGHIGNQAKNPNI